METLLSFLEKSLKSKDSKSYKIENSKTLEYQAAIEQVYQVLKSQNSFTRVVDWKSDFGACILLQTDFLNPENATIFVLGLDEWEFTVKENGVHDAHPSDDPVILNVGSLAAAESEIYLTKVNKLLSNISSKQSGDKLHWTPGFLYSKCVDALYQMNASEIEMRMGGFTDVGRHTGCEKRETLFSLVCAVIKYVLKYGLSSSLDDADAFYNRLLTMYYLDMAAEFSKSDYSKLNVNRSMECLQIASRYAMDLTEMNYWPDFKELEQKFVAIRSDLQSLVENFKMAKSKEFDLQIPNVKELVESDLPALNLIDFQQSRDKCDLDLNSVLKMAKTNSLWVPSYELNDLSDCIAMLSDDKLSSADPYFYSMVHERMQCFFLKLAQQQLQETSPHHLEIDDLEKVFELYFERFIKFEKSVHANALLKTHVRSQRALIYCLKFCILYEIGCQTYPELLDFSVALDYQDLEHLVLKHKKNWDLLSIVCQYLNRKRQSSKPIVFSGRQKEITNLYKFADVFVKDKREYDSMWQREVNSANEKAAERWRVIQEKQVECIRIRKEIDDYQSAKSEISYQLDRCPMHVYSEYRERHVKNPEYWNLVGKKRNLESMISQRQSDYYRTNKAPPFIMQALPKDELLGKRALFFLNMPRLLRLIWITCYQAEFEIFGGVPMSISIKGFSSFKEYYDRCSSSKSVITPLHVYTENPPCEFGSKEVKYISDPNDGVWYRSRFEPLMFWKYDPFCIRRSVAVERFTEELGNKKLEWAAINYGKETDASRGNLAIAKLYERPLNFTREEFIAFGSLRATQMMQIADLVEHVIFGSLPFRSMETHKLIQSVLYHIGEIRKDMNGELFYIWKTFLYDVDAMRNVASRFSETIDRLKETPKNHRELLILVEIISFFSQFQCDLFVNLLDKCSDISYNWSKQEELINENASDSCNESEMQSTKERKFTFLLHSLIAYELSPTLNSIQRGKLLELLVQANMTRDSLGKSVASDILVRVQFMMSKFFPIVTDSADLNAAAKWAFPTRIRPGMIWDRIDGDVCFYTRDEDGDVISLNTMNGIVLLNGLPPSSLPLEIVQHPLYKRVFGSINFTTVIDRDASQKTENPISGRYYKFSIRKKELHVIEFDTKSNHELLLLDDSKVEEWGSRLPSSLKKLYSHWQCSELGLIVFRPVNFSKQQIFYIFSDNFLYVVDIHDRSQSLDYVLENVNRYDRLLILEPQLKSNVLGPLVKFDPIEYIYVLYTQTGSLKVFFARYRLAFELKPEDCKFMSLDYANFSLCTRQQLDSNLVGFYRYLVLEKGAEFLMLVPQGPVRQREDEVYIEKQEEAVIDAISKDSFSANCFSFHHRLSQMKAASIESRIQLAALYAGTSLLVPEKWIGMTGFEMSINLIRQCWVNRPLSVNEYNMLNALLELEKLPDALVMLCFSIFKNASSLNFLYGSEENSIDCDQYICSVNRYLLKVQRHGPCKNSRLELTADELLIDLGIHKSKSRFSFASVNFSRVNNSKANNARVGHNLSIDMKEIEARIFELCDCSVSETKVNVEFPLQVPDNVTLFTSKIGVKMFTELQKSFEVHRSMSAQHVDFDKYDKCVEILDDVSRDRADLERKIIEDVSIRQDSSSLIIFWATNSIPTVTLSDLVTASFEPETLYAFNPALSSSQLMFIQSEIIAWMQLCVLEDRLKRVLQLLRSKNTSEAIREIKVHRKYNVSKNPEWLAFEVDQGIQIRPEQEDTISDIMDNEGCVSQLNMGLGKTRVIVPCFYLKWSREEKSIVRIHLLAALLHEGYDYMHNVLTASVFKKRIYTLPFSRDVKLDLKMAQTMLSMVKQCQLSRGCILVAPEQRLSLYLKKFELQNELPHVSRVIHEIESLPFCDIFDEVDEMMNPLRQLIYADGLPMNLDSWSRRSGAVFNILYILQNDQKLKKFIEELDISSSVNGSNCEFNRLLLHSGQNVDSVIQRVYQRIVDTLFTRRKDSPKFTLDWMATITCKDRKKRIIDFTTDCLSSKDLVDIHEFEFEDHFMDLLALRGLLAHGILAHCLQVRFGVNYGVVPNHSTPMAIPFRAANMPALRSEFAQPDCAIVFTVLSYYYIGLSRAQVVESFSVLFELGPSSQKRIYNEIYKLYTFDGRSVESLDSIDKLDLTNRVQVDSLHTLFSKNMILINFWLENVIFPVKTMVFPGKMVANSWNLADQSSKSQQCGFSGTDDSCILLPHPLVKFESQSEVLRATNGKMLDYLLKNAEYVAISDSDSSVGFINVLIEKSMEHGVDAFIDAGALFSNFSNKQIAMKFLSTLGNSPYKGVVYFDTDLKAWMVVDRKNRFTPLQTSSIHESEAFVFYDQSRCRGADMKLKASACAFLSIGPNICKDALMQAAGRLRKLDYGQTIKVVTSSDVVQMLRENLGLDSTTSIQMQHIILYTVFNSIKTIGRGLVNYFSQGIQFAKCKLDSSRVLSKEIFRLDELYLESLSSQTAKDVFFHRISNFKMIEESENHQYLLERMSNVVKSFGPDVTVSNNKQLEECERELEHERQREEEREKEIPTAKPEEERLWDYSRLLDEPETADGIIQLQTISEFLKDYCSDLGKGVTTIRWNECNILLSRNFAKTIKNEKSLSDFMRPVRYMLFFRKCQQVILLSQREADAILDLYQSNDCTTVSKCPILCNIKYVQGYTLDCTDSIYTGLMSTIDSLTEIDMTAIKLFNGDTEFNETGMSILREKLILNKTSLNSANEFCEHRGFHRLFKDSRLEETMSSISQTLHAKRLWDEGIESRNRHKIEE